MGSKKISIYDIAKIAGVSPASVSYVLNNKGKVSEKTKEKIYHAMKVTGYIPDNNAITLSTGKSHIIALCLPFENASQAFINNPFYGEFLGRFEETVTSEGYDVIIGSLTEKDQFIRWIRSRNFDGVVMLGIFPNDI